jgi:RimJ/RimL family protein N-acetyltransferase
MADETVCRDLSSAAWRLTVPGAEGLLMAPGDSTLPAMLIFERTETEPRLVGQCGLRRRPSGAVELYVWIVPEKRRQGFAAEACGALLDIGCALGVRQVDAGRYADSPAAAALLMRLGFRATGTIAQRRSSAGSRAELAFSPLRVRLCDRFVEPESLAA